jgi:hypothetical protein
MNVTYSSEILGSIYKTTSFHNPEDHNPPTERFKTTWKLHLNEEGKNVGFVHHKTRCSFRYKHKYRLIHDKYIQIYIYFRGKSKLHKHSWYKCSLLKIYKNECQDVLPLSVGCQSDVSTVIHGHNVRVSQPLGRSYEVKPGLLSVSLCHHVMQQPPLGYPDAGSVFHAVHYVATWWRNTTG